MCHIFHHSTELSCVCLHGCLAVKEKKQMICPCVAAKLSELFLFGIPVCPVSFSFSVLSYFSKPPFVLLTGSVYRPAVLLVCAIVKLKANCTLPLLFPGLVFLEGDWRK